MPKVDLLNIEGKKVGDTTPDQAEFIFLINNEIKDDLLNK